MSTARATGVAVGAVAALALLAACTEETPGVEGAARYTDVVNLDFDVIRGEDVVTARNSGWAQVELREVANAAGDLGSAPGPDGTGFAVRLPAFDPGEEPPLAALAVVSRAESDVMAPGAADFRFGADFSLDRRSDGTPVDDGNNVLQRGHFADPGQYKIQVDGGRVSCRVAGDDGELLVRARQQVEPETWYRVTCERAGDTLTLRLARLEGEDGAADATGEQSWSETGPTGEITMARPDSPLSIGAKVTSDVGVSRDSSDQFNGLIDNVRVSFAR